MGRRLSRRLSRRQVAQRRGRRRLVLGSLFVVAAAIAIVVVARVTILRTAIDAALTAQGFSGASYHIATVGLTTTRLVDLQLGPEFAASELSLHYRPWQLTQLQIDDVTLAGVRIDLSTMGGETPGPLVRLLAGHPEGDDEPAATLPDLPAIRVDDGVLLLPGDLSISFEDARLTPGQGEAAYELAVKDLALAHQDQSLAASGVKASVVVGATSSDLTIPFTVAVLRHAVSKPMIAPLSASGTMTRTGALWRVAATASGTRNTKFTVTGSYDGKAEIVEGRIALPSTRFAPDGLQPKDIAPPLAMLNAVSGAVDGYVSVKRRAGELTTEGAMRLDGLGLEVSGVPIENLSARVALAGDASQPVVRLSDARVTLAGGEFAIDDVALRPLSDTNRLVVQARAVDISRLLVALDVKGVSGEGQFAGRIPLTLSGNAVAIEGGKFTAQGAGILRVASQDAAAALAQGGDDANLLLQALADFRYDRLSLSIDKPLSGESRLALNTYGHNPAVLDGHPFQINVTVTTDLDKILGFVTTGGRLSQEIIRAIVGAKR